MLNLHSFRIVSAIEGLSFLVLLFIAMPAKYVYGLPEAVSVVGMSHGLLFLLFVFMAALLAQRHRWPERYTLFVVVAGVVPFGFVLIEKSLRRRLEAAA